MSEQLSRMKRLYTESTNVNIKLIQVVQMYEQSLRDAHLTGKTVDSLKQWDDARAALVDILDQPEYENCI
ncbi:hypothetical protein UFOVP116_247 [uncultured Caudovirales phage]|uniref:Uncharacterized protein n=1 Tax=uncultured Caudovirales phage TaxID=2100421 RepID=A0A6J5L7R3_9CAUD|nr:hypothetical protein UFOVP116_247 [uncultured Caudovirales phage]